MRSVRFGMVGAGFIGELFAEAVAELEAVDLVAVCARDQSAADAFAVKHGVAVACSDLQVLAADESINAVYIATPNSLHSDQATQMLRAGKHVLVEKPMALTAAQAEGMIDDARKSGSLLMEAYRTAFEPNLEAIRDAVAAIPQVRRAVFVKDQYSSRFDAYKAGQVLPAFDPHLGGGSIMDLGFYPVSLAIHLFGEPMSVHASGLLLDSGADAQGTIVLGYQGFEVVCLHSKVATAGIGSQVAGEVSVVTFDDCAGPGSVQLASRTGPTDVALATRAADKWVDLTRPRAGGFLTYEVAEFARLVRQGALESSLHPLANSLAALRILDESRRQVGVVFPDDALPASGPPIPTKE